MNRFQELGASVVALCPQRQEFNDAIRSERALEFPVLQDFDNRLAEVFSLRLQTPDEVIEAERYLGIDLPLHNGTNNWDLPIPSRYVIDTGGRIQYAALHADHQQRTEPRECIDAIAKVIGQRQSC